MVKRLSSSQSMYYQTSDLRSQLRIDSINSAMDNFNVTIREKAVKWYAHVLLKDYMKYTGDIQKAKNTYIDQICTSAWVTDKMKQYNDGTWYMAESIVGRVSSLDQIVCTWSIG